MAFRLTDSQWQAVAPLIARTRRLETRGRKRRPDRDILNGVLWMLQERPCWRGLGEGMPPFQTCHRRFHEWIENGTLVAVIEQLARDLEERGGVPLRKCFFDDTFGEGYEKVIISIGVDEEADTRHWTVRTRYFFQSPRVWQLLHLFPSPWVQQRLPADLQKRAVHLGAY